MRSVLVAVAIVAATPVAGLAQEVRRVEAGLQLSAHTADRGTVGWSPRLTLNITPLTAVEFTADLRQPRTDPFGQRFSGQAAGVHLRQALWTSGAWHLSGTFGAGVNRWVLDVPEQVLDLPDRRLVYPASRLTEVGPVVYIGQAVQVDVARRFALRADARLTIGENGGLRGMLGAVVPLGPADPAGTKRNALDRRDSLGNGLAIGAASGAVTGGALFGWAGWMLCEGGPCDRFVLKTSAFGLVSGAVVGGLLGAMVDSLITGPPAVQVAPVVTPGTRGGQVAVTWR